jgi:hypothetical protein
MKCGVSSAPGGGSRPRSITVASGIAYVVGTRKDAEFLKLRALIAPFGIARYN